jgi:hypothetical protein
VQPLLPWKSNKYYLFWVGICSLRHPACNALAPFVVCGLAVLYNNFPYCIINGMIFERKLLNIKYVFWFSLQPLSETFFIPRWIEPDVIKNVYWSSCKVPVILVRVYWSLNILDRVENTNQISNIIIIRPLGAELFHADRHDEANSLYSQICKCALRPSPCTTHDCHLTKPFF